MAQPNHGQRLTAPLVGHCPPLCQTDADQTQNAMDHFMPKRFAVAAMPIPSNHRPLCSCQRARLADHDGLTARQQWQAQRPDAPRGPAARRCRSVGPVTAPGTGSRPRRAASKPDDNAAQPVIRIGKAPKFTAAAPSRTAFRPSTPSCWPDTGGERGSWHLGHQVRISPALFPGFAAEGCRYRPKSVLASAA